MKTTEIPLSLAAAGCRLADRKHNEDITDELAVVDISTTVKIVVNCYNVWKGCPKTDSIIHCITVIVSSVCLTLEDGGHLQTQ